jgi:hypothetical protein
MHEISSDKSDYHGYKRYQMATYDELVEELEGIIERRREPGAKESIWGYRLQADEAWYSYSGFLWNKRKIVFRFAGWQQFYHNYLTKKNFRLQVFAPLYKDDTWSIFVRWNY